ncbi:MAG: aminotransferase class V-fold PLP-dependent enzyme [Pirellulaceae bacterium]
MIRRIYLDNAATSWPKPSEVVDAMAATMIDGGGASGRGGHTAAVASDQVVAQCRRLIAEMIAANEHEVSFAFNGTHALQYFIARISQFGGSCRDDADRT